MGVLAGAITCASAAVADAGIECVDLVSGGVAALVSRPRGKSDDTMDVDNGVPMLVMDPSPADGYQILSAAVVGYMAGRDEVTLLWTKGYISTSETIEGEGDELDLLMDGAIMTATAVRLVLNEAVKERLLLGLARSKGKLKADGGGDAIMS